MRKKAIVIGRSIAKYVASHAGWPIVEKIRIVGLKPSVQQETSNTPVNIKHVGSLPKCDGNPHNATRNPEKVIFEKFGIGAPRKKLEIRNIPLIRRKIRKKNCFRDC